MAEYTQTLMVAKAVTIEDTLKFQLDIEVTAKGDLPSENIFVVEIQDPTDPKEDAFARVTNVDDLEELTTDRTTAVDNDDTLYRVKNWTFYYDNVDTAVNAKDLLKSRIDALVTDWRTYETDFETTSETTEHPRVDTSVYDNLIDTYELMLGAEQEAKENRDTARNEYDTAVADAADAATTLTNAEITWDDCKTSKAWFQAFYDAMKEAGGFYQYANTFKTAAESFRITCTGDHPTEEAIFVTAYNTFTGKQSEALTAINTAISNLALFDTLCATKQSAVTTAQTNKTTADTTVATKRTAYEDAQSAYEAAQSASEAALAAIRALNPNYDPTTATPNTSGA
ncbi:MAG: hypothetical protein PVI90_01130 [Desulfobacteraceae bacterium]|jgi:hypothetical protein